jgi:hypothetical protein
MFSVNVLNTKVVGNFHVLLFLEFHDFRPAGWGVMSLQFPCQILFTSYTDLKGDALWLS